MSRDPNNPDRAEDERSSGFDDGECADLVYLREVCQSVWPTEPTEAAWSAVRTRIHEGVGSGRRRSPRPWWAIVGAAAAAALLAVILTRSWWAEAPLPPSGIAEEPYPVVEAEDVTILSMDARDVAALVVGEPPVGDDVEFVRAEDIHVLQCKRCPHSGNVARLERGEVPMVVTSVARADDGQE